MPYEPRHFARKSSLKRMYIYIIYLIVATTIITTVSFSKYSMAVDSPFDANVATMVCEVRDLPRTKPSDNLGADTILIGGNKREIIIPFKVMNGNEKTVSQVAYNYTIDLKLGEKMGDLKATLYRLKGDYGVAKPLMDVTGADVIGSYNFTDSALKTRFSSESLLTFNVDASVQTHYYAIKFESPSGGSLKTFDINVIATQKG